MNKFQAPNAEELEQILPVVEAVESLIAEKRTVDGNLVKGTDIYQKLPTAGKDISLAIRFLVLKREVYRGMAHFYVDQQVLAKLLEGRETMAHPMVREDYADEAIEMKGQPLCKQDILGYMTEETQGLTDEEAEASFQEAIDKERIVKMSGEEDLYDLPEGVAKTASPSSEPEKEAASLKSREEIQKAASSQKPSVGKKSAVSKEDIQRAINEFPDVVQALMKENGGKALVSDVRERLGLKDAAYAWNIVRDSALALHGGLKAHKAGAKSSFSYVPEKAEESKSSSTATSEVGENPGKTEPESGDEQKEQETKVPEALIHDKEKPSVILKDEVMGTELIITQPTDLRVDNGAVTYGPPGNFNGNHTNVISLRWNGDGKVSAVLGDIELTSSDASPLILTRKA